ncbi:MAG: imelysin [Prevotella sp.]|nr:imelysin [Prevotella sp.]
MKKIFKYAMLFIVACNMTIGFTSCDDDDNKGSNDNVYADKSYGNAAMAACDDLTDLLIQANAAIGSASLTAEQEAELKAILENDVDNVIVPTYKELADAVELLHNALGDLSSSQVTQKNVNDACNAFKTARAEWEKSEAFLMGPAAGFDIDPHIDSWPLNRNALHDYFKNPTDEIEDESILGFHALEFILFRNGQPRNVAEFRGNDTYKGFSDITGAQELAYAEAVIKDLLNHVYELQVSWDPSDTQRLAAVQAAGLQYETETYGQNFGWNLKNAGASNSTFPTLKAAIQQVLSLDDGSCVGISNEVGTAKIANPFAAGDISYVESPYSYNSITDFQNNIRSIENVWYGNRNGANGTATHSFHKFFAINNPSLGQKVEAAISDAINKIGRMPAPFVKYVSVVWNKVFEDAELVEYDD